ncbi:glutamyl-tRNA amidotransferase [Lepidopterella palustris CBS 459.81]|uniref:Glutamyl-tRNA(Gln) amidotransferase subunit A, mitochondrial n=1 Tax=Lepidopterella palustris CBS 459.81 TaxID=1314670 RepID=A0A8E2ELL7_9PEZI|nr:glutamyl-tRNA amidotransferase [Lepidopterella palustris CBS 459.81]
MSLLREAQKCIANQAARKNLNAFINLAKKPALLRQAEDAKISSGRGALTGKLIAVKDNICTSDLPTTAASGILKSFTSPYDATVVQKVREVGGIVAGKTNLDEFGMGSHSTHSFFGAVKHVTDDGITALSAGGSSGGSAVAVATEQCWAALGTDTGGSVRLPAAYTGVVGFKPSYGLLSRWGVIAYANSLDTVGILARDTQSARKLFTALNAHDPQDPTSLRPSTRARLSSVLVRTPRKHPLRIGIPIEYNITELHPTVHATWIATLRLLAQHGHTLKPVYLPTTQHALSAYYILAPAEASSNLAKYDGVRYGSRVPGPDGSPSTNSVLFAATRGAGFGPEVKRRILLGTYTLSAEAIDNYFIQAQKVRRLVQADFDNTFRLPNVLLDPILDKATPTESDNDGGENRVDVLVCPTAPTLPPTLASLQLQSPVDAYMNDVFTVPASLAGLPAVSVPVWMKDQASGGAGSVGTVGIQVIAQFGDDELVLDVARMIEEAGRQIL